MCIYIYYMYTLYTQIAYMYDKCVSIYLYIYIYIYTYTYTYTHIYTHIHT